MQQRVSKRRRARYQAQINGLKNAGWSRKSTIFYFLGHVLNFSPLRESLGGSLSSLSSRCSVIVLSHFSFPFGPDANVVPPSDDAGLSLGPDRKDSKDFFLPVTRSFTFKLKINSQVLCFLKVATLYTLMCCNPVDGWIIICARWLGTTIREAA